MVRPLPGMAAEGDRYELTRICSRTPCERRPVEKGLPETEAGTYKFEPVASPMVEYRKLFHNPASRRQRHPVLQANGGRAIRAEVELAKQYDRAVVAVMLERPVDRPHVPARQRPAAIARTCRSRYGELVAVVFVGDIPSRTQVKQFVRVEGLAQFDPQAPLGIGELELGATALVGPVGKQGRAGRHVSSIQSEAEIES